MRDGRRADRLHRLHRHRRAEVEPRRDGDDTEAEQDTLRVESADGDVADDEGDQRAEVAEGTREFGPVVFIPCQFHPNRVPKADWYSR